MTDFFLTLVKRVFILTILCIIICLCIVFYIALVATDNKEMEIGDLVITINENYYSGLITIVVSLFVLALPLAINAITANQDKRFSNGEMSESFYRNGDYIFMKRSVVILIAVTVLSYLKSTSIWLDIVIALVIFYLLYRFINFLKVVERYVADFPSILIEEEKNKIDRIING